MSNYFSVSHSIHMLSIQIDIKKVLNWYLLSVQQHQIVLLGQPFQTEFSIVFVQ